MTRSQIAAQLFTVRESCQNAADLAATARRVKTIGYAGVQISGVGPIPEEEIVRIMSGEGLVICATHDHNVLDGPDRVIDRLRRLGCGYAAIPFAKDVDFNRHEQLDQFLRRLAESAEKITAAGLTLGYHNHAVEFVRYGSGTVLDHILGRLPARILAAEFDTYYAHLGGADVVEWCEKLSGRIPVIHIKDYSFTMENKPVWSEIGRGNLNWRRIIPAAEKSGCRWFVVEQESCPGDPFDSLRISLEYLRANFTG